MNSKQLEMWNQKGSLFHSRDGKYEAIKAKNGSFKCWDLESHKAIGIFCDADALNDYIGYDKNGYVCSSVGAKGYGSFQ